MYAAGNTHIDIDSILNTKKSVQLKTFRQQFSRRQHFYAAATQCKKQSNLQYYCSCIIQIKSCDIQIHNWVRIRILQNSVHLRFVFMPPFLKLCLLSPDYTVANIHIFLPLSYSCLIVAHVCQTSTDVFSHHEKVKTLVHIVRNVLYL